MRVICVVLLFVLQGCTIEHREGNLPEIEFEQLEEVCTKKFTVGTSQGGPQAKCVVHLKTTWFW